MEQLTVRELAGLLNYLTRNGHGDKVLLVADDVEGNGYHGMFYGPMSDPKEIKEVLENSNGFYDTNELDPEKIVLLG